MLVTRALQWGKRAAGRLIAFVLVSLLLFVVVEGLCSTALLVVALRPRSARRQIADRVFTRYDSELGWVNIPNEHLPNFFGPGMNLSTNARGFRNVTTISEMFSAGKERVVCSGDSFTFGYGVGDRDTWCAQLSDLDPQLDTVNIGVNGYGVDQSYLMYKRESPYLRPNIQIFAFITDDFRRMEVDHFIGAWKPVLSIRNGKLAEEEVPVPRHLIRSKLADWAALYGGYFNSLRTVQLINRAAMHLHLNVSPTDAWQKDQQTWTRVFGSILDSLKTLNQSEGSKVVLVYLPTEHDRCNCSNANLEFWRSAVSQEAANRGIVFIDLVDDFQKLPQNKVSHLFIQPGAGRFVGEQGHYTKEGYRYITEEIYSHLIQTGILPNDGSKPNLGGLGAKLTARPSSTCERVNTYRSNTASLTVE